MSDGKVYSESQLERMFLEIGKSKENLAAGILRQQQEEEQARLNNLKGRLGMLSGAEGITGDDESIAEEMRRIDEEIAKIQAGQAAPEPNDGDNTEAEEEVLKETDVADALETLEPVDFSSTQEQNGDQEHINNNKAESALDNIVEELPELDVDELLQELGGAELPNDNLDAFTITDEVLGSQREKNTENQPAEQPKEASEDELELLGVGSEPTIRVFLSVAENANETLGAYAYRFVTETNRVLLTSSKRVSGNKKQVFCLAIERILEDIKDSDTHIVAINMTSEDNDYFHALLPELVREQAKIVKVAQEMKAKYDVLVVASDSAELAQEEMTAKSLLFDK